MKRKRNIEKALPLVYVIFVYNIYICKNSTSRMSDIVPDTLCRSAIVSQRPNTFTRVGQKHDPIFHFFPDFRKDFPTIIKRYEKFLISYPQRKNVQ